MHRCFPRFILRFSVPLMRFVVYFSAELMSSTCSFFFFQAEDGIRDGHVTGVQTCALPIYDFGVVAEIADRIAVLRLGELVESGPARQILHAPRHEYTQSLIAAVPALTPPPHKDLADAPKVLQARGLSKTFGRGGLFSGQRKPVAAVRGLGFDLRQGETLGIVGESGSGKTTVARIVTRLLAPDAGEVMIEGHDLTRADRAQLRQMRRQIQMIFQDPMASLNPRKRVIDLIAQGLIVHGMPVAKPMNVRASFSPWSSSRPRRPTAPPTKSPAASASAPPVRAPSQWSRAGASRTSPYRRWMSRFRRRCCACLPISATG